MESIIFAGSICTGQRMMFLAVSDGMAATTCMCRTRITAFLSYSMNMAGIMMVVMEDNMQRL